MRLSVLDQSTVVSGSSPADAIRESLDLARHTEALGYHRYWLSEHHDSAALAGTAPEILAAAIAATTHRIRVGSAGVMLPHYAALKVAEQFRVLDAIAPGRIDLGLGRAPGSDRHTAHALNPNADTASDHFPAQVRDLLAWVRGEPLPDNHPFGTIVAQPTGPTAPEPWILGSSDYGAQVAAHFGLPYCFAYFITEGHGAAEALHIYRTHYRPSREFPEPCGGVCIWALAAETQAEADLQFASRALWRLRRDRGEFAPLASPEEATAHPYTDDERARLDRIGRQSFYGTADALAGRLRSLADELGVEEIAVLTTAHDPAIRRHSYTLLARAFGLGAKDLASAAD